MNNREFQGEDYLENSKYFLVKKYPSGIVSFKLIPSTKINNPNVVAYVKKDNKNYTNKEYGTLFMYKSDRKYKFDVYSKRPILSKTYGYIKVKDNEYIEVYKSTLMFVLISLIALLIIATTLVMFFIHKDNKLIEPDKPLTQEEKVNKEENKIDLKGEIVLPDGQINIFDTIKMPKENHRQGALYSGEIKADIYLVVDGTEHKLLSTDTNVEKGILPTLYVDYSKLDFELIPGSYYGRIYFSYFDDLGEEYSLLLVIKNCMGGSMQINYQDEVEVDLVKKELKLSYKQETSSSKTKLQVVLTKNNEEYVLAESELLDAGDTVKTLTLKDSMASKLQEGEYGGLLRIMIIDEDNVNSNLNSDIDVAILVK